jgi:putative membrane protein
MVLHWLVATLHLLALPLGLGSVVVRGRAFAGPLDSRGLRTLFAADALWGLSALLWISTGVWRAFFGLEKGTPYYVESNAFWAKMTLLLLVLALEIAPMITLIRWRVLTRRGETPDTGRAATYARLSTVQSGLVVLMVFAATAMARGWFH